MSDAAKVALPAKAEVAHEAVEVKEAVVQQPPAVETKAIVEQPSAPDPAAQLANLAASKDLGGYGLVAGVVAVVGGAGFLKFYNNIVKGKQEKSTQEFELKKMEIEHKAKQQDEGHKACSVERAALTAQLASMAGQLQALTAKLEEAQLKASAASAAAEVAKQSAEAAAKKAEKVDLGDFDPEEAEERLAKIEKAVTALKKVKK
jgi:valyl-tRNA synthetase